MGRQSRRHRAPRLRQAHAAAHCADWRTAVSRSCSTSTRRRCCAAGDGLRLEDGRIVAVEAAPERLLEITCADERALARIAWHLGNRHLATEIGERTIHIRDDHVIADMVRGLGAEVRSVERPFNPEGGAYGHGAVHGHSHGDGRGHAHDHHHDH